MKGNGRDEAKSNTLRRLHNDDALIAVILQIPITIAMIGGSCVI